MTELTKKEREDRAKAIYTDYDTRLAKAPKVVSEFVKETAELQVFIVFLLDNIVNEKNDLEEGDRANFYSMLYPLFPQIQNAVKDLSDLLAIRDADGDLTITKANLDAYIEQRPHILEQALNRYPSNI